MKADSSWKPTRCLLYNGILRSILSSFSQFCDFDFQWGLIQVKVHILLPKIMFERQLGSAMGQAHPKPGEAKTWTRLKLQYVRVSFWAPFSCKSILQGWFCKGAFIRGRLGCTLIPMVAILLRQFHSSISILIYLISWTKLTCKKRISKSSYVHGPAHAFMNMKLLGL